MPVVNLKVDMMCDGCVGAVKRILGKMDGVVSCEVNLETKKVCVTTTEDVTPDAVLERVAKCGKHTEMWSE